MASIFRKPGSPFWFAAYRDAQGQRRQKTTKTKDKRLAADMARQFEKLAEAGRKGALTESIARAVCSDLVLQATGEGLHFRSCREWLNEWLNDKTGTTAESTLKKYKQVISAFLTHLDKKADQPLGAISPKDVRTFRDALAEGGRSPSTVNQTIKKTLTVPFVKAVRLGYIKVNPCSAVEDLRDDHEGGGREVFTPVQIQALLQAVEGDWRGAVLAGYYTGLRLRDIANLTWSAVDFEAGVIRLKTKKTRTEVTPPLHPELEAWLKDQTRGIGNAPVFPSLAGKGTGGKHGLSGRFAAIMDKAGVKGRQVRAGGKAGRTTRSLTFHSLRHSFISALANAGIAPDLRQKLAGHSDSKSHARYTHHEIASMREAVASLPSMGVRA